MAEKEVGLKADSLLTSHMQAVQAITTAVSSTLGPKGLDTMLVDREGRVIVTNDGATILERMKAQHPISQMIIQVAKAQQNRLGDGTTTATLLATRLIEEGWNQVKNGVPVAKVIAGIQRGVQYALQCFKEKARPIYTLKDEWLQRIAYTASRENEDITFSVIDAAKKMGREKLLEKDYRLTESILAHPQAQNDVLAGVFIQPASEKNQMPNRLEDVRILLVADDIQMEQVNEESLGTELGFKKQERLRERYLRALENMVHLQVGAVVVMGRIDPLAEEILTDAGIMVIEQVHENDITQVSEHTKAQPIKRNSLYKPLEEISSYLGHCSLVERYNDLGRILLSGGQGKPFATILVSATTEEIVMERERICKDTAAAVQAAVKGGYVPGGGAVELFIAREVEKFRDKVQGMERFGVSAVVNALSVPMTQVVTNAGFNPLEKIELVKAYQLKTNSDAIGIDCDQGMVADMMELGVVDPLLVKYHALQAAGEVSAAILRIHTVVEMIEF